MRALITALPMGRLYPALLFSCVTGTLFELAVGEPLCVITLPTEQNQTGIDLWGSRGSSVHLNCTIQVHQNNESFCDAHVQWSKNGEPISNLDAFSKNSSQWFTDQALLVVSSILTVSLEENEDFGIYSCKIWNRTTTFRIQSTFSPSHTGAVVASLVLFVVLVLSAVVYARCRLNFKLWYKNSYGDYEFNDGKMYDAYISYINSENDRKFVNYILKPHLENKYGHKLLLNDTNILPGAEPSAELIMNISRCRRLIVVLSQAYLEQEWCSTNFRQGLFHLLELSRKPIFIIFQSQQQHVSVDVIQLLQQHQTCITTLIWGAHSMTPSSGFWKELALVMPRMMAFHSEPVGDPQTVFQGDKDPMLTTNPDYLDCRPDPDPAGDLGLRMPVYEVTSSRPPVFPTVSGPVVEAKPAEIDVSDLGSRNYAARTDFYCLVTEDDL